MLDAALGIAEIAFKASADAARAHIPKRGRKGVALQIARKLDGYAAEVQESEFRDRIRNRLESMHD